jgi:hypothetical protein
MMSMPKTVNAILLGGEGSATPHFPFYQKNKSLLRFGREPAPQARRAARIVPILRLGPRSGAATG